jgi:putative phosphoesterase
LWGKYSKNFVTFTAMTQILLLSDTHAYCEKRLEPYLAQADEIWHAGDIGSGAVLDWLYGFEKTVRIVHGNIDDAVLRKICPKDLFFTVEGVSVWITHIAGHPKRYAEDIKEILLQKKPKILVCGHSHILRVMYDEKHQVLYMNPGAMGNYGVHKVKTALRFQINKGKAENLEVIEWER